MSYDYADYNVDYEELRCSTTLSQFRWDDPVLNGITSVEQGQAYQTFCDQLDALKARDLNYALDGNLDIIGKWVGESRNFAFFKELTFFTFDNVDYGFDNNNATWFVDNAPTFGGGDINNEDYRNNIRARIFKNHVKYGSIPEIINFAKLAFDVNISLTHVFSFDWQLIISADTPSDIIAALQSQTTNNFYDSAYFLPLPIGRRLVGTVLAPENAFRFDTEGAGWDEGRFAVRVE